MPIRTARAALLTGAAIAAFASTALFASAASAQGAAEAATDTIIVTATKRAGGVNIQEAPLAVTAFGEEQLDARFVRNIEDLSYAMPNVQLNDVGTSPGIANFAIRGLGINSSIPSVDPAVGVFVDGMYLGINAGVILDTFDLEGVEVLRGPQGLLFGRNVTGGAVLVRTKAPSLEEFEASGKVAVESGLNYYAMAAVGGPIVEDTLGAKLAVYYNDDKGWFENLANGNDDFGASQTWIVRPSFAAQFGGIDTIVRLEHGEIDGPGPAAQNHGALLGLDRDDFDFAIDFEGFTDSDWNQAIWETNIEVPGGVITNIAGWRTFDSVTGNDIDSTPNPVFHAQSFTGQEQISEELRYSGTWEEAVDVTAGLYYFNQLTEYVEERAGLAFPVLPMPLTGGGEQYHTSLGAYSQFDLHFTDTFTLNVGVRYTYEEKDVKINDLGLAALVPALAGMSLCSIPTQSCDFVPGLSFVDKEDWADVDGKFGFQYQPTDELNVYGFWTSGFRSGGYNFRSTPVSLPVIHIEDPGPTEPESVETIEIGSKYSNGMFVLNGALFHTEITDMQRELNVPSPFGVSQLIRNTADATLQGVELEGQVSITDDLFLSAFVGYTDAEYDRVIFDLTCNPFNPPTCNGVGPDDLALDIPRVSPWTYGAGAIYDLSLGSIGTLTSRIDYSHRDKAFYTDNNAGVLPAFDNLDASLGFTPGDHPVVISIYGRNLLDDVSFGGDTQLPPLPAFGGPGASFSPLNKGRVLGVEAQFKY